MLRAILLLSIAFVAFGCSTEEAVMDAGEAKTEVSGKAQPQTGPAKTKPAEPGDVASLCGEPSRYLGKVVKMTGVFQGFMVTECRFPEAASAKPLTRGDWLFRTGDDCIYVTGGVPTGVDTIDPQYVGRRLELTAEVSRDESGKLYLAFREGEIAGD